jgi:hypothetical protein
LDSDADVAAGSAVMAGVDFDMEPVAVVDSVVAVDSTDLVFSVTLPVAFSVAPVFVDFVRTGFDTVVVPELLDFVAVETAAVAGIAVAAEAVDFGCYLSFRWAYFFVEVLLVASQKKEQGHHHDLIFELSVVVAVAVDIVPLDSLGSDIGQDLMTTGPSSDDDVAADLGCCYCWRSDRMFLRKAKDSGHSTRDFVVGVAYVVAAADRILADEHVVDQLFDVVVVVVVVELVVDTVAAAAAVVAADLTSYFLDYSTPCSNSDHNSFHQLGRLDQ